jgi:chromosome partitioning protein
MGVTISVVQRKGGVGKTTIATHLAAGWAIKGYKVLLIDTDPQGDACRMLGMKPSDGLYKFLVPDEEGNEVPVKEILKAVKPEAYTVPDHPPEGALMVLPSSSRTSAIAALTDNPFLLSEKLEPLRELFDVIVIDSAPTISAFDSYVYLASDYFIFVTQCETLSINGLREGLAQVKRFGTRREEYDLGAASRVLGIIPNQMDARLTVHKMMIAEIAEEFGDLVWQPVMYRAKFKEATDFGQLIYAYTPSSGEAKDMMGLVDRAEKAVNDVVSG